jgi:Fe-Mn family superoxide dismutase
MNRASFLKSGALLGTASLLSTTNAFAQNLTSNDIDKLVDADGNYVLQPLPYTVKIF